MVHTKKREKINADNQIAELQRLHTRAASWLAGLPHSTFRNRLHLISPNEDGTIDAREVLKMVPEIDAEKELSDDEREIIVKAVNELEYDSAFHLLGSALKILDRFGDSGASFIVNEMRQVVDKYEHSPEYRDETDQQALAAIGLKEVQRENDWTRRVRGEFVVFCPKCKKYRHGLKRVKRNPAPEFQKHEIECDDCYIG